MDDVVLSERPVEVISHVAAEEYVQELVQQYALSVSRCSACGEPTLATYFWVDGWSDPGDPLGWKVIYPPQRNPDALPQGVRARYLEMLELQHAPDAFAVRAGRLLEAVCTDQGVARVQEGKSLSLATRLDRLVDSGALPEALAEQGRLVKDYRNIGGHDDDVEIGAEDVPLLRGFVESLLDYVYWGPARLERGREALQERIELSRAGADAAEQPSSAGGKPAS